MLGKRKFESVSEAVDVDAAFAKANDRYIEGDYRSALRHYNKAKTNGHSLAVQCLEKLTFEDPSIKSVSEVHSLFMEAKELYEGDNFVEAFPLFLMSACAGYKLAQEYLIVLFDGNHEGIRVDDKAAGYWVGRARAIGDQANEAYNSAISLSLDLDIELGEDEHDIESIQELIANKIKEATESKKEAGFRLEQLEKAAKTSHRGAQERLLMYYKDLVDYLVAEKNLALCKTRAAKEPYLYKIKSVLNDTSKEFLEVVAKRFDKAGLNTSNELIAKVELEVRKGYVTLAELGVDYISGSLATFYINGRYGCSIDLEKAAYWAARAGDFGNEALIKLLDLNFAALKKAIHDVNNEKRVLHGKKASPRVTIEDGLTIGELYFTRKKEGDLEKALSCFLEVVKLQSTHPLALYRCAKIYSLMNPTKENRETAFKYCLRAAEAGEPNAILDVIKMYDKGIKDVINSDMRACVFWAKEAVKKGFIIPKFALATHLENGLPGIVVKDIVKAVKYYEEISDYKPDAEGDLNDPTKVGEIVLEAKYRLALILLNNHRNASGVVIIKQDLRTSLNLLEDTYDAGYEVNISYFEQLASDKNKDKQSRGQALLILSDEASSRDDSIGALKHLKAAADIGNKDALGILYRSYNWGDEVLSIAIDKPKSMEYCLKAAQNGDEVAQYDLAERLLISSDGERKNVPEGLYWLLRALKSNYQPAEMMWSDLYEGKKEYEKIIKQIKKRIEEEDKVAAQAKEKESEEERGPLTRSILASRAIAVGQAM